MAPPHSRQLLIWTLPTLAFLLGFIWYRKKKTGVRSDPGGITQPAEKFPSLKEELEQVAAAASVAEETVINSQKQHQQQLQQTDRPRVVRSLSGVDSAPIDIIIPKELKSSKSNPIIISDEDLDLEIKKIQSMKVKTPDKITKSITESLSSSCKLSQKDKKSGSSVVVVKRSTPSPKKSKLELEVVPEKTVVTDSSLISNSSCQFDNETKDNSISSNSTTTVTTICKSPASNTGSNMAQKEPVTVASVESKLSSLKLVSSNNNNNNNIGKCVTSPKKSQNENLLNNHIDNEELRLQRQSSERDSANHSPADVMLASPSLSSISDNHSEGSSDSGKGGSDVVTPPSRTPAGDGSVSGDLPHHSVYEFVIPQQHVGKLIGRHGNFVHQIKDKTRASILIKRHPESKKLKVCAVEGTPMEIENALELIREKFPEKIYPEITLEQVSFLPPVNTVALIPDHLHLKLVEGINNDTIVCCMVAPNHLFLHQPTHPTFPNLNVLSSIMNACYSETNSPLLPTPIPENTICAAHSMGAWYRAIVLSTDLEADTSCVKFLDYGGYYSIENSMLRQIRADFMLLPFQAAECFLANIRPVGGEEAAWAPEAFDCVADLTKGSMAFTQIAEYLEDGTPLVLVYVVVGPQQVVFLNQELVTRGFAEWITPEEQSLEGAVGVVAT